MTGSDCCNVCDEVLPTNIPGNTGPAGADGADGTDGRSSLTYLVGASSTPADYVTPKTFAVEDSTWMVVGQIVVMDGPTHYRVISKPSDESASLLSLGYAGDVAVGSAIADGALITTAGMIGPNVGSAAAGSPEGAVTASPGGVYMNTTDESFWMKKTGTNTNTGWVQVVATIMFLLSILCAKAVPPVQRTSLTTNLQTAGLTLVTNISRFVTTNDVSVLNLLTNISRFVLSSNNVFSGSNYMIGTFVGNGNALTNFGSNQFNGKFVGSGISLTNVPVNVGTNATAVSGDITIYLTNQDGRVYRVAAQAL